MDTVDIRITQSDAHKRLDVLLAELMEISRGEAQRILETGAATIDGASAKANYRVRPGDRIEARRPEPTPTAVRPEEIPLPIVYEDEDLLVINKPRGMVVHPAPGAPSGTLVNAVLAHVDDLSGIGGELRPGIVHRLDKDTSGLMVVAKNNAAHISLQAQIQAKTAERIYRAILWGVPTFKQAVIDAPIGRHPGDRKKMAVLTGARQRSREAVTELTVLESLGQFCLAEAKLRTGRTHQIRVHCAYIGHPVVGDPVYGGMRKVPSQGLAAQQRKEIESAIENLHGQALHAYSLSFEHPRTKERMTFTAPMPEVIYNLLGQIRRTYQG